jgi:hypothetical protein
MESPFQSCIPFVHSRNQCISPSKGAPCDNCVNGGLDCVYQRVSESPPRRAGTSSNRGPRSSTTTIPQTSRPQSRHPDTEVVAPLPTPTPAYPIPAHLTPESGPSSGHGMSGSSTHISTFGTGPSMSPLPSEEGTDGFVDTPYSYSTGYPATYTYPLMGPMHGGQINGAPGLQANDQGYLQQFDPLAHFQTMDICPCEFDYSCTCGPMCSCSYKVHT